MRDGIEEQMSHRISWMKLMCAFMVVVIHSQFLAEKAGWIREFIMYGVCRCAVPFFFAVSGYFLSRHMDEDKWWRKEVGKRILGLGIPYFIFVCSFMILSYFIEGVFPNLMIMLKDIGADPRVTPLLAPLWYVRALFILILLSPLLKKIVRGGSCIASIIGIISIAIICFLVRPYSDCSSGTWYLLLNYGFSLEGLLYFSIGMFLAGYKLNGIASTIINKLYGLLFVTVGFILFAIRAYLLLYTEYEWQACQIGFFAIPFMTLGLFAIMPRCSLPSMLNSASFPIYVLHFFILSLLGGRISRGGGGWFEPDASLLHWLLRIVVAFFGSIIIAAMLSRFCPRVSVFIFGGRLSTMKY